MGALTGVWVVKIICGGFFPGLVKEKACFCIFRESVPGRKNRMAFFEDGKYPTLPKARKALTPPMPRMISPRPGPVPPCVKAPGHPAVFAAGEIGVQQEEGHVAIAVNLVNFTGDRFTPISTFTSLPVGSTISKL